MNLVVYSKDRPAQLELLLRSLKRFWNGWETLALTVVHTHSSDGFARGYDRVRELHPEFVYICERDDDRSFKQLTLAVVDPAVELTAFLVDDDVLRRPFSLDAPEIVALSHDPSLACVALRLAPHVDYTYPLDRLTPPPLQAGERTWNWADGDGYWNYPMSLDGHVFRTADLLPLLGAVEFSNPNTLENELSLRPLPAPRGICPAEAVIVNIPANRVQNAFPNRCGDVPPEALNVHFRAGALLALEPIAAVENRGAHEEIPFTWERTSAPRVAVVIPCHNHGRFLEDAVGSVLAQTLAADEVVIVDDGSTDDSRELARALAAAHRTVRVLEQPASGHPAHARNAGIRATSGDYVLCLDADDKLSPGFLAACVTGLEQTGGSVAYGPQQDFGTSSAYEEHAAQFDLAMLARCNFVGSASLFRRAAWEDAGGYDASVGYEDWDFWVGCAAAGHLFLHVPDALWYHRNHDGASVFAEHARDDARTKAEIVLKRPHLYSEGQLEWAHGVLAGDLRWTSQTAPLGIVPTVNGVPQHAGPAVSVIVPTHNRPEQLRETLESIAAQTFRDFEVIVVNDAGTDVRDVVESFADRMVVTYLAHEQNRQLAASRNTGIRAAQGRYIAYLDDDDAYYPNHLETLVGVLAATGSRVAYADAARARVGADGEVTRDVPYSLDFSRDRFLFANYVPVNCIVHERSCLDEVGLFDEELATPLEDWELWIRLSQATDFVHVPQVTCEFREADAGRISTNVERFHVNRQRIVDKHAALVADRPDIVELQRQYLGVVPSAPASAPSAQPLAGDRLGVLAFSDELLADPGLLTVARGVLDEGFALVACGPAELERPLRDQLGRSDALIPLRVTDPAALVPLTAGVAMVLTRRPLPAALAGVSRLDGGVEPAAKTFEVPADLAFGYQDGEYTCEANVLHWLERLITAAPDPVLYDIGANIGFYSTRLAEHARAVVAFEPVSETYGLLTRNIAASGAANVLPISVAVSDRDGTAEINLYSSSGNNGLYVRELPAGHPLRHVGRESVETARLDTLVAQRGLPLPTVVKIDVEGAELPVLRGAVETLRRARPAVVLEYAETTSRDAGYTAEQLAAELEASGYQLYGLAEDPSDNTLYARDAFDGAAIANVIAIPPGTPFAALVGADVATPANVYDELVAPGALVFDIGANVGARTREFLERGAFVVAVEPQPACMAELERSFGDDPRVLLVENALGAAEGVGTMLCTSASTIASMSPEWVEHVRASGRFSEYTWADSIEVPVSTMSALIAEVGVPAFCKIDVEGFEAEVLAGLDTAVPAVSFEFVPEHLEGALASIERLDELGEYEYNLSLGESLGFESATWHPADEMRARLTTLASSLAWGDVYARLATSV